MRPADELSTAGEGFGPFVRRGHAEPGSLPAIYPRRSEAGRELTRYSGGALPTFGGTESMTKRAHTTPPPNAAARRMAPPVLTYSIEQLPSFNAAFYAGDDIGGNA